MRIKFIESKIKNYFKDAESSDMEDVYFRACEYFKNTDWTVEVNTFEEVEQVLFCHVWSPYDQGEFLLGRWFNAGLVIIEE